MKKQLLILCTALSIGQSFAAISQNDLNNALKTLTQINTVLKEQWNPLGKVPLNSNYFLALKNAIQITTNYAQENSKNILGKYDMEILSTANTLRYRAEQMINLCIIPTNNLVNLDMTIREDQKNIIINNITQLAKYLGNEYNKINKTHITISKQKAKNVLIQTIHSLLSMLESIKNKLTEMI